MGNDFGTHFSDKAISLCPMRSLDRNRKRRGKVRWVRTAAARRAAIRRQCVASSGDRRYPQRRESPRAREPRRLYPIPSWPRGYHVPRWPAGELRAGGHRSANRSERFPRDRIDRGIDPTGVCGVSWIVESIRRASAGCRRTDDPSGGRPPTVIDSRIDPKVARTMASTPGSVRSASASCHRSGDRSGRCLRDAIDRGIDPVGVREMPSIRASVRSASAGCHRSSDRSDRRPWDPIDPRIDPTRGKSIRPGARRSVPAGPRSSGGPIRHLRSDGVRRLRGRDDRAQANPSVSRFAARLAVRLALVRRRRRR
jgi:hypothetical protein